MSKPTKDKQFQFEQTVNIEPVDSFDEGAEIIEIDVNGTLLSGAMTIDTFKVLKEDFEKFNKSFDK